MKYKLFVTNNNIINKNWVRNHYDERNKYNISNKHLFYQEIKMFYLNSISALIKYLI